MSIKVNKKAPNFSLFDQNNNKIELHKLKFNLILFFYPKDNTPGCTKEAISFSKYKKLCGLSFLISPYTDAPFSIKALARFAPTKPLIPEMKTFLFCQNFFINVCLSIIQLIFLLRLIHLKCL